MSFGNGSTSFADAAYSYDSAGRIVTVGNSADTLTYTYMPGTNIIGSSAWQNATLNTVNTYDSYKRLTNIAVNGVNVYGYTLNDKNQRTGATLPDGNTWSYDYDAMGQLTGAVKQSSGNTQLAGMSWLYDQIGNRTSATENNVTTSYTSNLVNQYTQIASQLPTYDVDGNMLTYNGWTYTWNGENRLISAESSDTRLEFSYDYMGRRIEKKVYSKGLFTLYNWSLAKHHKFVYDGYKLIAEFDILDADAQPASYLWQPVGLDVPLMRIADNAETYYIADGNKNILAVRDSNGTDLSNYTYTPFGTVENPGDSDENPFRFSSEYHDDETGLVYYNYRYYSPELGRWIKRDPAEESGGVNLYVMTGNNAIGYIDNLGLWAKVKPDDPNDFVYCAQKGDTLRGLAKQISGSELDYACLWPVSVKSPKGYPNIIQIKDKYDASNLEKKWNVELKLALYAPMENTMGGKTTSATNVASQIENISGQGATPISYMLLRGHADSTMIGGQIGDDTSYFKVSDYINYNANSYPITYERASQRKGPKRCWFARNATVRFAGCNSSKLAKSFATSALRKGATAYGTKYYIGVGNGVIWYAPELDAGNKWYPKGHDKAPQKSNDMFNSDVWEAHGGRL
jgi:rhs family protein-like protein